MPTKYGGENDDFDFRFLSSLWSCASLSDKVDVELRKARFATMGWGRVLDRHCHAGQGHGRGREPGEAEEVAELLERLRTTSKAGQKVRALVPGCPQRKPFRRARR